MKKPSNKNQPVISITATLSEARLLKKLVEKLATHNRRGQQTTEWVQPGWRSFNTSSIEAFVSGNLHLVSNADLIKKPFVKGFVFTCLNGNAEEYSLVWGSSLS